MKAIDTLELQMLDTASIRTLVDWAKQEGWNPGQYDFEVFRRSDPEGFYGFYHNNELIAGGAVVSYNGEFGFMGLFIVRPEFRGKGIGKKLWIQRRNLLLKRLNEGAPIGMDGVVDMQPFYERGGFRTAFRDERYECHGSHSELNGNISQIRPDDLEMILKYDTDCFGFERKAFMQEWLFMPDSYSFKFTANEALSGIAVIRKVHSGYKIGPLFADSEEVAEALYRACLNYAPDDLVYLDIPTPNENASKLMKKYDAKYVFECARMYHGKPPVIDLNKIYGITTFELG
jgi:GNAT superfamily N-acetyltransferase